MIIVDYHLEKQVFSIDMSVRKQLFYNDTNALNKYERDPKLNCKKR